jgi:hypothetical protein
MLPEAMLVGEMLRREERRVGERRWRMGDRDPLVASGILHGDGVRQTLESDCQLLAGPGRGEAAMKGLGAQHDARACGKYCDLRETHEGERAAEDWM